MKYSVTYKRNFWKKNKTGEKLWKDPTRTIKTEDKSNNLI
jgi:hypothetical protein